MTQHQQLPSWVAPQTVTPLVAAELPPIMSLGRYLTTRYGGRVIPGLTTTVALGLARLWHHQGAAGSHGDAVLMGALAVGATVYGTVSAAKQNGAETLTAVSYAAGGAFALTGVAAYTTSPALACIMWLVSTGVVYAVSAGHWRRARERGEERRHELVMLQTDRLAAVQVAAIQGQTQAQALAIGLTLAAAIEGRQAAGPGFDPAALAQGGLPLQLTQYATMTKEG